jgi:hypothetical protein
MLVKVLIIGSLQHLGMVFGIVVDKFAGDSCGLLMVIDCF